MKELYIPSSLLSIWSSLMVDEQDCEGVSILKGNQIEVSLFLQKQMSPPTPLPMFKGVTPKKFNTS